MAMRRGPDPRQGETHADTRRRVAERRRRVADLWPSDLTVAQIAAELGCSPHSVASDAHLLDLPDRKGGAKPKPKPPDDTFAALSKRRLAVMRLVRKGLCRGEVARRLGLPPKTVTNDIAAMRRLGEMIEMPLPSDGRGAATAELGRAAGAAQRIPFGSPWPGPGSRLVIRAIVHDEDALRSDSEGRYRNAECGVLDDALVEHIVKSLRTIVALSPDEATAAASCTRALTDLGVHWHWEAAS